jgi:hypothetical protein
MDFDFASKQWTRLPGKERAMKCQQWAQEAEHIGFHGIAKQWRQAAAAIEAADESRTEVFD